jgi:hypothetical protein
MREYPGEFEVHVTARLTDQGGWERFHGWCTLHQFKSVHIVLARGEHADQPMATWWRSRTRLTPVLAEAQLIAAELQSSGFPVVRVKVEAGLLNEDVPQSDEDAGDHAASNYFEHHVKLLRERTASSDRLLHVCEDQQVHLSRNAWRDRGQEHEERFVTLRSYRVGKASTDRRLRKLLNALNEIGEQVIEVESEYSVYDSNLDLDRGWLPSEMPAQCHS